MADTFFNEGLRAYARVSNESMSKMEIVFALYRGMMRNICTAKNAFIEKDFETVQRMNEKTSAILVALQSHLDYETGGEYAKNLNRFYTAVYLRLNNALLKQNPVAEFEYVYENIHDVYLHWQKVYQQNPQLF